MDSIMGVWNAAERVAEAMRRAGDTEQADRIMADIRLMEAGASAMRRLERAIDDAREDGTIA